MNASNHERSRAARVACAIGGAAVTLAVCATADEVSHLIGGQRGTAAGVLVLAAAFMSCWALFRLPRDRHPAPPRRTAPGRDPHMAGSPAVLADSREPTQLAA